MKLFTRTIEGDPSRPSIMIIHGLYSSSSNWYTVARMLHEKTGRTIKLIDLPNHGHSEWSDKFNYRQMAEAIKAEIDTETIVLGHSLGGRVATILAVECKPVKGLIVIDISPVSTPRADRAFTLFHSIFLQHLLEAKRAGVENIAAYLEEKGAPGDMTTSVDQAYKQMNIEAVAEGIADLATEWFEIFNSYDRISKPTMIVRGGASPYLSEEIIAKYPDHFDDITVKTVENGTHRLHQEYPEEFTELVREFVETKFP